MNDNSSNLPPSRELTEERHLDAAIEEIIERTERRLLIAAPRLVLSSFRSPLITDRLRHIVVGHEKNHINILISHEKKTLRENTYLCEYVRRHPSRITLKVTPDDLPLVDEVIVVADGQHSFHQPDMAYPRGDVVFDDRALAETLEGRVKSWWDRSAKPAELFVTGL